MRVPYLEGDWLDRDDGWSWIQQGVDEPTEFKTGIYGMIRTVASWGLEVEWCEQREWRKMMEKVQYATVRKCTGEVVGATTESVQKVAIVESKEVFARAMAGRFLAQSMCDSRRAGVAENRDRPFKGASSLEGDRQEGGDGEVIWDCAGGPYPSRGADGSSGGEYFGGYD